MKYNASIRAKQQAEKDMRKYYAEQGKLFISISEKQLRKFFTLLLEIELTQPKSIITTN